MSGSFGNLFGSKSTPVQTSSTPTGFGSLPQFGQDAFKNAVTRAQTASQDSSLFAPTAFNQDQLKSFDLARSGYTDITPETFGNMLGMFTNPFEDQVVNKAIGDLRTTGQGLLSDLGQGATAAGGFGGTRQAALEADTIKNLSQQAADTSAQIRSDNYNNAVLNAIGSIGFNNDNKQQWVSDLANIGGLQQAQSTQEKQAPLGAIEFLLQAAQGLPTGGGAVGSTLRENTGALQKIGNSASGLATLGALFSDVRLKHNIQRVGQKNGHNIYEFSYKNSDTRYRGVMAQEVQITHPHAVKKVGGYLTVNYDALGLTMEEV